VRLGSDARDNGPPLVIGCATCSLITGNARRLGQRVQGTGQFQPHPAAAAARSSASSTDSVSGAFTSASASTRTGPIRPRRSVAPDASVRRTA
jgi:hypothetical protein